ncbi:VRR-NUC domain-containing protein [Pseudomonas putida]|uniref:VRR-NUC domain-containing protein n=1 Tax=Pseudomonas putida TaxID=303 RepID=UPI000EF73628|nr:VRR-NUC domain-containing protein [Pseudomonas putida]AYN12340.1 nuclease [Pseudomonas putida]
MNASALRPFKAKPARAKPVDREGQEQAALMQELQLRYPQVYKLIYHVPNGGHRVKAGVPDLVLPMARGGYFGLYIEFKAMPPFDAPVSPGQDAYLQALADQGYLAIVCRGNIDAVEAIRAYLLLPATVAA